MAAKDWVSGTLSAMALLVSVSVAYLTIFQQRDDLRVSFAHDVPTIGFDHKTNKIRVAVDHKVTLINSGNRAVAVRDVGLSIVQSKNIDSRFSIENSDVCFSGTTEDFQYKMGSFVVGPGEIVIKRAQLDLAEVPANKREGGELLVDLSDENKGQAKYYVIACVVFILITPDSDTDLVAVPMTMQEVPAVPSNEKLKEAIVSSTQPIPLVRKSHT